MLHRRSTVPKEMYDSSDKSYDNSYDNNAVTLPGLLKSNLLPRVGKSKLFGVSVKKSSVLKKYLNRYNFRHFFFHRISIIFFFLWIYHSAIPKDVTKLGKLVTR